MALKIGIAGLRRGAGVAQVFLHHKECQVVAGCDLRTELAKSWTEANNVPYWFDDYSKFCEADLDAILVATPAPVHVPCVVEAMENGKATPTINEKDGWIMSCKEQPIHDTCDWW